MQISSNSPTSGSNGLSKSSVTSSADSVIDSSQFSALFSSAGSSRSMITEVSDNVFRMTSDDSSDTEDHAVSNEIVPTQPNPNDEDMPLTGSLPFAISTIPPNSIKVSPLPVKLSSTSSSIMIQVISHIQSLSAGYKVVNFAIPSQQLDVRITGVGPTLKIELKTTDETLRNELKSSLSDLSQVLKKELSSPYLDLVLDSPNGKSSNGQNQSQSQNQDQHSDESSEEHDE